MKVPRRRIILSCIFLLCEGQSISEEVHGGVNADIPKRPPCQSQVLSNNCLKEAHQLLNPSINSNDTRDAVRVHLLGPTPPQNMDYRNLSLPTVSKACANHLTHLMTQYSSFVVQSHNIADGLAARLHRLKNVWPGSFQQCLSLRSSVPSASGTNTKIQGQFCLPYFFDPPGTKMNYEQAALMDGKRFNARYPVAFPQTGICVPDSCTTSDVQEILKFFLSEAASNWTIFIPQEQCQTDRPRPVNVFTKIVVAGLILLVLLVIAGTLVEVTDRLKTKSRQSPRRENENGGPPTKQQDSIGKSAITCFSLFSNTWYLFKMNIQLPGNVESFNGARFLAALGCQVVHVVLCGNVNGWNNIDEANFLQSVCYQGFFHLPVLLQVAVAMSGAGLSISTFHRIREKDKHFYIIPFYLRRLYRLSVPYFISLALVIGILPHLSSGPRWPDIIHNVETCKIHWWTNVLYINNYVHVDRICQMHSWYLSTDVQLLLIAPLLIAAFNRSGRLGTMVAIGLISVSVGKLGYHAYFDCLNSLDLTNAKNLWKMEKFFFNLYFLPYSRLGCYSLAIALGYVVYTRKNFDFSLTVQRCTSFFFAFLFWLPFFLWYYFEHNKPTLLQATLCEAFGRISWSAAVMFLALALHYNFQDEYTRGFRWLLYRKIFVITSKLNYSVYLIHITVIQVFFATRPEPMEYSISTFLTVIFGLLVLTHILAIPFTLLAELPFFRLERLYEQRRNIAKEIREEQILAKQK